MKSKKLILLIGLFILGQLAKAQHQEKFSKEVFVQGADSLLFRQLLPKDFNPKKSYPLVLFLHGAGERGADNTKQLTHGAAVFTADSIQEQFPAIVLFPQCPTDDYWSQVTVDRSNYPVQLDFKYQEGPTQSMKMVLQLLDTYLQQELVDKDQVYVMGLSMGGMGTFELIYRKPETFAAAIPICGAGDPKTVNKYAQTTPIWAFHGAQDNVVAPTQSLAMVNALLEAGAHPKFTLYDFANHNSWDSAFVEPDLLPWLFSKTKNQNTEKKTNEE